MSDNTYNNYLKIKPYLDEHKRGWECEEGLGKDLIEDARLTITEMALNDEYELEDLTLALTELSDLIELLSDHQEDYVKVEHAPMGGYMIKDIMKGE